MKTLNILFIGNSYTGCNNLPDMLRQLALSAQEHQHLFVQAIVPGGKTLEWHSAHPETLEAIRESKWDFVVLQEQSLRPVEDKMRMHHYAEILDSKIKNSGAETVLYLTWARQHIPEMQEKLTEAYVSLSKKIGARVAPVGIAWAYALDTNSELVFHESDKSHPNAIGSYLAACVFYATFFGRSPIGLTKDVRVNTEVKLNLSEDKANFLQSIAWNTVQEFAKGMKEGEKPERGDWEWEGGSLYGKK